jgi:hypothetical protein
MRRVENMKQCSYDFEKCKRLLAETCPSDKTILQPSDFTYVEFIKGVFVKIEDMRPIHLVHGDLGKALKNIELINVEFYEDDREKALTVLNDLGYKIIKTLQKNYTTNILMTR